MNSMNIESDVCHFIAKLQCGLFALEIKVVALLMGIILNLYNENVCLYSIKQNN